MEGCSVFIVREYVITVPPPIPQQHGYAGGVATLAVKPIASA